MDSLVKANEQLSPRVGNRHNNNNNPNHEDYTAPRPKTLCSHSKIEVMHAPDNYFGLEKTLTDALGDGKVFCNDGGHLK